jgi:hypothetical protein
LSIFYAVLNFTFAIQFAIITAYYKEEGKTWQSQSVKVEKPKKHNRKERSPCLKEIITGR